MPGISVSKIPIPFRGAGGISWQTYWNTLISAIVEDAAPTHVVLTFPTAQPSLEASGLSAAIDGEASAISSASWTGTVLTVVLADTVVYGDTVVITLLATGGTATATNNTLADYYVRADGSNTSPYDTPAKAATQASTLINYLKTALDGSGAVVSIGSGTFNYVFLDNANLNNIKIVGVSQAATIISSTEHCLYNTSTSGALIKRMSLLPGAAAKNAIYASNTENEITFQDVNLISPIGHTTHLINNLGCKTIFRNVNIYSQANVGFAANLANDASADFINILNIAAEHSKGSGYFNVTCTGTVNFRKCNLLDSSDYGILFNAAGTYNVTDCIITGGYEVPTHAPIRRIAGTLTVSNTHVISSIHGAGSLWIDGDYTDGGGNLFTNINPKFKEYQRKGYILPRIDDPGNFAYAKSLGDLFSIYGYSGSYFTTIAQWISSNNAALREIVSDGNIEVGCHSYSHSDVSVTGKIFDVTKGAETITISRTTETIVLSGGGTVSGFKTKTLAAIKAELEGLGATVTGSAIYGTSAASGKIQSLSLGEVIADGSAVNQIDLLIDNTAATGFYKTELVDSKSYLADTIINGDGDVIDGQTGVKYVCRSFGAPYQNSSVDARLAAIASGYICASSESVLRAEYFNYVGNIDMYAITNIGISLVVGTTEETTRHNARVVAFLAAHTGLVIGIISHTASDASLEQWGWILEEWAAFENNINVLSYQLFRDEIFAAESGWTDDEDGTVSRIYTNGGGNYELEATSELIGAASDGGNIGAY